MNKINLLVAALALIAISMSSCSKSNNSPNTNAYVMYYNGCVGVSGDGSLEADVNSVAQENGTHILYNSFLTGGYQNVTAGNSVNFAFTNASLGSSLTAGVSETITAGAYYTVFAGGEVGGTSTVPYVFMTTDVFPTPSSGMASIRCVNLSPYSDSTSISPSAGASITIGSNIAAAGYSSFTSIPAATYTFYSNSTKAASAAQLTGSALAAGKSYTLVYSGSRFASGTLAPTFTLVQNN